MLQNTFLSDKKNSCKISKRWHFRKKNLKSYRKKKTERRNFAVYLNNNIKSIKSCNKCIDGIFCEDHSIIEIKNFFVKRNGSAKTKKQRHQTISSKKKRSFKSIYRNYYLN